MFFESVQAFIAAKFGWLYVVGVNVILIFCIYLAFSRFKNIRLGGPDCKPEFSTWAWISMLFNAGIGLVLMFYSVAEPILHFSNPPYGEAGTIDAAQNALNLSYLHWGLHGWAIYALMGLSIAFFCYNKGLPLGIRWVLYPLLGDRLKGPIGHFIDTIAVVATMFGLATTLGLGIQHINSGMHHLFGIVENTNVQVILIAIITIFATISVVSGLHKGVQILSKIASIMAVLLMIFMLVVGPTLFILGSTIQSTGYYLQNIISTATWMEVYKGTTWMSSWTTFYWGWWFAWAPFVSLFIARISYGRTIKEFIIGVLFVPSLIVFIWMGVFGNAAIYQIINNSSNIDEVVSGNFAIALFSLYDIYPGSQQLSILSLILIITFFVTSSDSGSLVASMLSSKSQTDINDSSPLVSRVTWAILLGVVAAVLMFAGGLTALQTSVIITGVPFAIIIVFACIKLHRSLEEDLKS